MLQFAKFYEKCFNEFKQENFDLTNIQQLFLKIDKNRSLKAKNNILYYLDQLIWTKKTECIDDHDFDNELKKEVIHGLHLKNKIFGTYTTVIKSLGPLIQEINQKQKRPARILEIGSGMGKLTMALYEEFQNSPLQVQLTGSDILPSYIEYAKDEAKKNHYNIDFQIIDAFKLDAIESNSYDIVFTLHCMHHFQPNDLGKIMKGALKISTLGFIGIDGYRGLGNLLFMMISGAGKSLLSRNYVFFHDSFISGRKMYAAKQLEILGKIFCPKAITTAEHLRPGLTIIKVLSQK